MRIDDGGGGTGNTTSSGQDEWASTYKPVQVDIHSLFDFWKSMTVDLGARAMTATSEVLSPVTQLSASAFLGMSGKTDMSAGIFPEAVVVADLMTNAHAKFAAFFKDVGAGITCIGDAAAVISEMYSSGDAANGASINDVLFAFNDPLATRPKELPKGVKTDSYAAQQAAAAAASGQNAMALTAPESSAIRMVTPAAGVTIYYFADGSSKTVTQGSDANSWAAGTTTTTTYYFNGKTVGTTTQSQYSVRGGYTTMTTSTSPGDNPNAVGTSTTEVVTNPDGSQDITTKTIIDGKGNVKTTTTHVDPPPPQDTSGQGPVEAAENKYQTSGTKDYVQKHGMGY